MPFVALHARALPLRSLRQVEVAALYSVHLQLALAAPNLLEEPPVALVPLLGAAPHREQYLGPGEPPHEGLVGKAHGLVQSGVEALLHNALDSSLQHPRVAVQDPVAPHVLVPERVNPVIGRQAKPLERSNQGLCPSSGQPSADQEQALALVAGRGRGQLQRRLEGAALEVLAVAPPGGNARPEVQELPHPGQPLHVVHEVYTSHRFATYDKLALLVLLPDLPCRKRLEHHGHIR
mmetsp:Transcript_114531/g.334864  ORF Transcript_114531/g.334864 Transcript_114531/m.334864 type:complete len:235 (-) Transcript_114531:1572-2276(-)